MSNAALKKRRKSNKRTVMALASCIFGICLILFGFGIDNESKNGASAPTTNAVQASAKKSLPKWNVALGNMVVLSPELGFTVNGVKESSVQEEKIGSAIEGQLVTIRQLYREASENNGSLMGHIRLQFTISPSGDVSQVKELSARISDSEFKKAVFAEVSKWYFPQITSESVTINCPLLFVREGMDVTSVMMWEKALGHFEKPTSAARKETPPAQDGKPAHTANPRGRAKPAAPSPEKSAQTLPEKAAPIVYRIKYPTSIRKEPNFSAAMLEKLTTGTKVTVVSENGNWLEVRTHDSGSAGFVRKEFVTMVDLARK